MLTPEQIKNLKPGDPILIHGTFDSRTEFGNICYISKFASEKDVFFTSSRIAHPSLISLPENGKKNTEEAPKYNPCRPFKEGDIVEPCQVKGRWFGTAWKNRSGIRFTVTKDEDEEGVMWVKDPDSLHSKDVEAVFFQLVTPVEAQEPH